MAIAELHGKHLEEDLLTSDVFGAFKYLPPSLGLLPFLAKAKPFVEDAAPLSCDAGDASYYFWPRAGRREPDLLILLKPTTLGAANALGPPSALIVEVKYHSPKHNLFNEDNSTNEDASEDYEFASTEWNAFFT